MAATIRISLGLVCLAVSAMLAANTIGFDDDEWAGTIQKRSALCEAVALHCSSVVHGNNIGSLQSYLESLRDHYPELLSIGVRQADGRLLLALGDHESLWSRPETVQSLGGRMTVEILAGRTAWGTVELLFQPVRPQGLMGWVRDPLTRQTAFFALVSLGLYVLYLRNMLTHLDPSRVIPDRVRTAFDTLAEGLLVLDENERIVLANRAFAESISRSAVALQGLRVTDLPWNTENPECSRSFPWQSTLLTGEVQTGALLAMNSNSSETKTYRVNTAPIIADDGVRRGALVSFNDVTQLERRKEELKQALEVLRRSREKIRRQNKELTVLATQDPLTGCLNRRSFFESFESLWSIAKQRNTTLSCILFDIDFFKSINDEHGHSAGDEVLRQVSQVVRENARTEDLVCRYGGEEFCLVLPHVEIGRAVEIAERNRQLVQSLRIENMKITVSLGVSALELGAANIQEMLDQADRSLYVAKRNGRNQVVRWDDVPDDLGADDNVLQRIRCAADDTDVGIPFHAVTALLSALSFRDSDTAEHSRRVAELCVLTASDLLSVRDTYVLEIAGLLHDIGKIGVPDAVLLKPGPLNEAEWHVMASHDQVGIDIISSTFDCPELARIIRTHHAWFGGNSRYPELPTGNEIPLAARILAIADAYDAMVSDRIYRKGRPKDEAVAELRRCAGTQFDPDLVNRFIETINCADCTRVPSLPEVSKQTALRLGLQMERLTEALDKDDTKALVALAGRLRATALDASLQDIVNAAGELEQTAKGDAEVGQLVNITANLLDLCRSTQKAYLEGAQRTVQSGYTRMADVPVADKRRGSDI